MAHLLIADDEPNVRNSIKLLLDAQNHTYNEAGSIIEIVKAVQKSEKDNEEPYDLILLDYNFEGATGIDAIRHITARMGSEYCEHRIIIITGSNQRGLAAEFASLGAINHLLKPISQEQFWITLESALTRREIYIDKKNDWETALELLENRGILEDINVLNEISRQHEELKYIHNALLDDIARSEGRESSIAKAYEKASEALNNSPGKFETIFTLLVNDGYTNSFVRDIQDIFEKDRLHFLSLQSYLNKINNEAVSSFEKHLSPGATNHYEYRIGRCYRLYFRRASNGRKIFERFGHKNVQDRIIHYLSRSNESDISNNI